MTNVFLWMLQTWFEPFIWGALQWIWNLEVPADSAALPLQFYSYSATSVLLWLYEKLPHPLILTLLAVGFTTLFGFSVIVSCCSCRVSWVVLRVCFRLFVVKAIKIVFLLSYRLLKLIACVSSWVVGKCWQVVVCALSSSPTPTPRLQVDAVRQAIEDRALEQREEVRAPAIDSSAFRPRRRRIRSTRLPPM